jgi:hypothetical protein
VPSPTLPLDMSIERTPISYVSEKALATGEREGRGARNGDR